MSDSITNTQDTITGSDIISRIEYLELDRENFPDEFYDGQELESLIRLREECEQYGFADYTYLIRDDHFVQYAQEYWEEIGGANIQVNHWPYNHIDWEAAADELKYEWSEIDFDGVTYYLR